MKCVFTVYFVCRIITYYRQCEVRSRGYDSRQWLDTSGKNHAPLVLSQVPIGQRFEGTQRQSGRCAMDAQNGSNIIKKKYNFPANLSRCSDSKQSWTNCNFSFWLKMVAKMLKYVNLKNNIQPIQKFVHLKVTDVSEFLKYAL